MISEKNIPDNGKIGSKARRGIKHKIIKLRKEGKSLTYIKKELKCAKSTIDYHISREGLSDIGLQQQVITKEDQKNIYEYTKEHTIKQAVDKFGFGRTSIIRYMFRKNLNPSIDKKIEIVEYRKTHNTKDTANNFGVSISSVNKYFREYIKKTAI